ncbi:MAG: cupin domain-containing protein [Acidobacteriia bacterium]|nr:cupin domain-containing protein [Terriglobia bacterium]
MFTRPRRLGRLRSAAVLLSILGGSAVWIGFAQAPKQNPNFQGTVTPVKENSDGNIAHFRFEPGSRTKWHSHERGQIILVEEGVCRSQVKGGPVLELHAGETTYAPAGVVHWHGAGPDQGCVQYNISRGGITWMEEVSDKEFAAPAKK